jgi:microcystin-dependent protein
MPPVSFIMPTSNLQSDDVIGMFEGPRREVNYAGSLPATLTITLTGSATVLVGINSTGMAEGSATIPNPNTWASLREVRNTGATVIPLSVLSVANWVRISILTPGEGTCVMDPDWQVPGEVVDPISYLGLWNADTNTPEITPGVGLRGSYYSVIVAGNTDIDGTSDWDFGSHIVFNGTAWIKHSMEIDGAPVTSVAGKTGDIVLNVSDIINIFSVFVQLSQMGAPNGVAPLDGSGLIPLNYLPTAQIAPTGTLYPFLGASAPSGYTLADGGTVSRFGSYASLFALVGETYGAGDGINTFGKPDLRGRTIFGLDNMGGIAANRITLSGSGIDATIIGETGGTETVTLTLGQENLLNSGLGGVGSGTSAWIDGGATAHSNMPPAMILNWLIKL